MFILDCSAPLVGKQDQGAVRQAAVIKN